MKQNKELITSIIPKFSFNITFPKIADQKGFVKIIVITSDIFINLRAE